jgi:hypothetical protein
MVVIQESKMGISNRRNLMDDRQDLADVWLLFILLVYLRNNSLIFTLLNCSQ